MIKANIYGGPIIKALNYRSPIIKEKDMQSEGFFLTNRGGWFILMRVESGKNLSQGTDIVFKPSHETL
jgi:hypothetical protein